MGAIRLSTWLIALAALAVATPEPTRAARPDPAWSAWRFLLGEWVGEGRGGPGRGAGAFSFREDLDGRTLMRRSRAEYPPARGRPAFRHDDLMVVWQEPGSGATRALFLDNEGHVIHYSAVADSPAGTVVLTSEPDPVAPSYRFTYWRLAGDSLAIRFEVAPPGSPDSLATYLEATARRVPVAPAHSSTR